MRGVPKNSGHAFETPPCPRVGDDQSVLSLPPFCAKLFLVMLSAASKLSKVFVTKVKKPTAKHLIVIKKFAKSTNVAKKPDVANDGFTTTEVLVSAYFAGGVATFSCLGSIALELGDIIPLQPLFLSAVWPIIPCMFVCKMFRL